MKTKNTKVVRMLRALAVELKDMPDKKIQRIHDTINDEDGYDFDFKGEVETLRYRVQG
jgi:hypothetical protein